MVFDIDTRIFHRQLEERFIKFLKSEKGFGEETLIRQMALRAFVGKRIIRPDLAIVDHARNRLLALVEVSTSFDGSPTPDKIAQLKSMRAASLNLRLPAFLVLNAAKNSKNDAFRIFALQNESEISEIVLSEFPTYEELAVTAEVKDKAETSVERNETVDKFKYVAWFGALVTLVLLGANLFHYLVVTVIDLSLLTMAIGLSLLPFAAKMKVLGLEWEPIAATKVITRRKRRVG